MNRLIDIHLTKEIWANDAGKSGAVAAGIIYLLREGAAVPSSWLMRFALFRSAR
jgi:hypothetical protein